jgi:putative endonuclease
MGEKVYSVYIMTNKHNDVFYTGITNDIKSRAPIPKLKSAKGLAKKYNDERMVYYEACGEIPSALAREKQIKANSRKKNVELIESINPKWLDINKTK